MFVYSCSIKICASGFSELLESTFCLLLVEAFFLQKVVEMLEDMVVSWWEVRWIWQMRQNLLAWFVQLLKLWLYFVCFGILKRIEPFLLTNACCRYCSFWCISLICWAYFSKAMVLSELRKRSGSDGQQITEQWPWPFCGASLALGSTVELLLGPTTALVIVSCDKNPFHHTSQSDWEMVHCCCVE